MKIQIEKLEIVFEENLISISDQIIYKGDNREKYLYYVGKICNAYQILIPDNFVHIKAGSFIIGSTKNEDETPHKVTLSKDFMMQAHTVTQKQWVSVMGVNPSSDKDDNNPVTNVSWDDCQEYLKCLNLISEFTYRLPTEAEWEYCCRACSNTLYCFGDDENELKEYGWYDCDKLHNVGLLKCNAFGLYDMHGNVWEWCADWYGDYPEGDVTDPIGASTGSVRVVRGGVWLGNAVGARSAYRGDYDPGNRGSGIGFRVLRLL